MVVEIIITVFCYLFHFPESHFGFHNPQLYPWECVHMRISATMSVTAGVGVWAGGRETLL